MFSGIAGFPEHGTDLNAPYHNADKALYHAKRNGKGRFYIYAITRHRYTMNSQNQLPNYKQKCRGRRSRRPLQLLYIIIGYSLAAPCPKNSSAVFDCSQLAGLLLRSKSIFWGILSGMLKHKIHCGLRGSIFTGRVKGSGRFRRFSDGSALNLHRRAVFSLGLSTGRRDDRWRSSRNPSARTRCRALL